MKLKVTPMYATVGLILETKLFETTKPESHRNYVDIPFMLSGGRKYGLFVDCKGLVEPC